MDAGKEVIKTKLEKRICCKSSNFPVKHQVMILADLYIGDR